MTLDECLAMLGEATAALLSCSCSVGAVLAGAPAELVERLATFGEHVGIAFQAVDDLLGIWGEPDVTADVERPAATEELAAGRGGAAAGRR